MCSFLLNSQIVQADVFISNGIFRISLSNTFFFRMPAPKTLCYWFVSYDSVYAKWYTIRLNEMPSEEFHEFTGLDDSRLSRPYSHKPSFKFGTTPFSHTDSTISKYFKEMHSYMAPWVLLSSFIVIFLINRRMLIWYAFHFSQQCRYNKTSVKDGLADVLNMTLDAFIYDGTVLDYLVAQDEECRLLTVGSWYAMTGKLSI